MQSDGRRGWRKGVHKQSEIKLWFSCPFRSLYFCFTIFFLVARFILFLVICLLNSERWGMFFMLHVHNRYCFCIQSNMQLIVLFFVGLFGCREGVGLVVCSQENATTFTPNVFMKPFLNINFLNYWEHLWTLFACK